MPLLLRCCGNDDEDCGSAIAKKKLHSVLLSLTPKTNGGGGGDGDYFPSFSPPRRLFASATFTKANNKTTDGGRGERKMMK